ncbi:hypothetical protein [Halorussus sp. MSC15.2]|uniref:hypothetical protein n=1 Tax=Halorussus sp. MSC15.2 TaxID=2283638 RepID=UPI0013D1BD67|nr:hypothetical protein [Halorussus sp. MSC15.2]NEU55560.1 hypothetical protein [Halorussus sp. MSC15.2]
MTKNDREPLWAEILRLLHNHEQYIHEDTVEDTPESFNMTVRSAPGVPGGGDTIEFLADKTGREENEIRESLRYLQSVNCARELESAGGGKRFGLTAEGFKIAHEREMQEYQTEREDDRDRRQHDVNRAIALLTIALVLINFIRAGVTGLVGTDADPDIVYIILGFGGILAVVISVGLWRAGLLSSWEAK